MHPAWYHVACDVRRPGGGAGGVRVGSWKKESSEGSGLAGFAVVAAVVEALTTAVAVAMGAAAAAGRGGLAAEMGGRAESGSFWARAEARCCERPERRKEEGFGRAQRTP